MTDELNILPAESAEIIDVEPKEEAPLGFSLRSVYEPERGYFIGMSPNKEGDQENFELNAYLQYRDIDQAINELKSCLTHAEGVKVSLMCQDAFKEGQKSVTQGDENATEEPTQA